MIELCGLGGGIGGGSDGRPWRCGGGGVERPLNAGHAPETGGIGEASRRTDGGGAGGTALAGFSTWGRVAARGGGAVPRARGGSRGQREKGRGIIRRGGGGRGRRGEGQIEGRWRTG